MGIAKTIVIKSNMNCNLRCKYCYEFNRNDDAYNHKVIGIKQLCEFIERTAKLFPDSRILWMLHGGEPLINGIEYFGKFLDCIRLMNQKYPVDFKVALQTNATLLTEEWIKVLENNSDLLNERIVSISIDGTKTINDEARISANGESSYDMVMKTIDRIKRSDLVYTTISVIGEHNVSKPDEVFNFIKKLSPNLCKFIPCYNYNDKGESELLGIKPTDFAEFMCKIFDLWISDLTNQTDWFVIDPIATIISKLSDTFVSWCEYRKEKCDNFICLYPDGELWLCDTFNHNTMRENAFLGNINKIQDSSLIQAFDSPCSICNYDQFYGDMVSKCQKCDIYKYCNGGCLPYRAEMQRCSNDLFEDYCKAKHILINYIKEGVSLALSQPEDNI